MMTIIYEAGYTLPVADEPLTHARMLHSGNWKSGTATGSTTAAGYSDQSPTNSLTYEKWKPTAVPASWEFDLGSAKELDTCCIAGHTLGTDGCTIRVQHWDGAAWVAHTAATAVTSDEPIMIIFEPFTAQLWRINVTVGTAPEIAVIRFGNTLQFPQPMLGGHAPITSSRQTVIRGNRSETGESLGRTKIRTQLATSYDWSHLNYNWATGDWYAAQKAIETEFFFLAWRPDKDGAVAYGQVDNTPMLSFMGVKDYMSLSMRLRALAYD